MVKRMFNSSVILDDSFLDLSADAKALYLMIGVQADNEGFCGTTKSIARMAGIDKQYIQELVNAGFLIDLSNNVYAVADWYRNNNIASRKWAESDFVRERSHLNVDDNKRYYLVKNGSGLQQPYFKLNKKSAQKRIAPSTNDENLTQVLKHCYKLKPQPYQSIDQAFSDSKLVLTIQDLLKNQSVSEINKAADWANTNRAPRTLNDLIKAISSYWPA